MNKLDFLSLLRGRLVGLPLDDVEERLRFYSEMIDDRVEEGMTEMEAVAAMGSADEVAQQIVSSIPLYRVIKESVRPKRRLTALEMILLIVGFPVWFPLLLAVAAVVLSLYVALWSVVVSLWAVFASLVGCAVGGFVGCAILAIGGHVPTGLVLLAAGLICAGLSILAFYGCRAVTMGIVWLGKQLVTSIKQCFIRKGETLCIK